MVMESRVRALKTYLLVFVWAVATAVAQTHPASPDLALLKHLALDELVDLEVTSVSRRSEQLMKVAAAIDVLTGEQIERGGATNLPDALRLIPGLDVAQANGHTWAISSRGFANTTANKMEVLLDGRSLYSPLFSGVFWDAQDVLLADLARIEVIRGPGAVQWGANAVNGVVNLITKPAAETQGWRVGAAAGTEDRAQLAVRYGGRVGAAGYYRAYLKTWARDALQLTNGQSAGDGLRLTQGGGRVDLPTGADGNLTLSTDAYRGAADQPAGAPLIIKGGNLMAHWDAPIGANDKVGVQFFYDRVQRDIPRQFAEKRDTFDLQGQGEFHPGRQTIVAGARARISADQIGNSATLMFLPSRRTTRLFSVFAQDEMELVENRWRLIGGSTLEHNSFTGWEVQPTLRLAYTPTENMTWWASASHAVRTPSRIDTDFFARATADGPLLLVGNSGFQAEQLRAIELGWRWRPQESLWVDLTAFHNQYDRLRSQEPTGPAPVPFTLGNMLNAKTTGLEMTLAYQPVAWWQVRLGWRELAKSLWLDPGSRDASGGNGEGNDPRRIVSLQNSWEFRHGWSWGAVLRYTSRRPAPAVPAYFEADTRLAWQPNDRWEWALTGRNLLHAVHREFGAGGPTASGLERSVTLSFTWKH